MPGRDRRRNCARPGWHAVRVGGRGWSLIICHKESRSGRASRRRCAIAYSKTPDIISKAPPRHFQAHYAVPLLLPPLAWDVAVDMGAASSTLGTARAARAVTMPMPKRESEL